MNTRCLCVIFHKWWRLSHSIVITRKEWKKKQRMRERERGRARLCVYMCRTTERTITIKTIKLISFAIHTECQFENILDRINRLHHLKVKRLKKLISIYFLFLHINCICYMFVDGKLQLIRIEYVITVQFECLFFFEYNQTI